MVVTLVDARRVFQPPLVRIVRVAAVLCASSALFDRPVFRDFPAFNPKFITGEAADPRHKCHGFPACVGFVAGTENLNSHGLLVLIQEAALKCGHMGSSQKSK
jgi:hypothetical protein